MSYKDIRYDENAVQHLIDFGGVCMGGEKSFRASLSDFHTDTHKFNPFVYEPINPENPSLVKKSDDNIEVWNKYWADLQEVLSYRREAYGTLEHQAEYIVEKGIEATQLRVLAIKAKFPKPNMPE